MFNGYVLYSYRTIINCYNHELINHCCNGVESGVSLFSRPSRWASTCYQFKRILWLHLSHAKKFPGWVDYIGDEILPSYNPGLFHRPLIQDPSFSRTSIIMESIRGFLSWLTYNDRLGAHLASVGQKVQQDGSFGSVAVRNPSCG